MLNEIVELINQNIAQAKASLQSPAEDGAGDSSILIEASSVLDVCKFLKENDKISFNALQAISGVDYTDYIEVCYMLANFDLEHHRQVILKTRLTDRVSPELDSVHELWLAANWQERECYDMLGVSFKNHPDPRRILCPDDWEGFPLRKDYMAAKTYRGMEVYPEDKMNKEDREFIVRQKQMEAELVKKSLEKGL